MIGNSILGPQFTSTTLGQQTDTHKNLDAKYLGHLKRTLVSNWEINSTIYSNKHS